MGVACFYSSASRVVQFWGNRAHNFNLDTSWLLPISYPTRANGIIVKIKFSTSDNACFHPSVCCVVARKGNDQWRLLWTSSMKFCDTCHLFSTRRVKTFSSSFDISTGFENLVPEVFVAVK